MTAWARWNWTSGHTSPSSPTQPASESEQPSATTGHKHGRHPLPGWLFKENFLLPFGLCSLPFPLTSIPYFYFSSCPALVVLAALSSSLLLFLDECWGPAQGVGCWEDGEKLYHHSLQEGEVGSHGVTWVWGQAIRGHICMKPAPQHRRFLLCCHLGSLSAATSPGAEKQCLGTGRGLWKPRDLGLAPWKRAKSLGLGGGEPGPGAAS